MSSYFHASYFTITYNVHISLFLQTFFCTFQLTSFFIYICTINSYRKSNIKSIFKNYSNIKEEEMEEIVKVGGKGQQQ